MNSILPSQIVSFIDDMSPEFGENPMQNIMPDYVHYATALVKMCDSLDNELLALNSAEYMDYILGVESTRRWILVGGEFKYFKEKSAFYRIHSALSKCPDFVFPASDSKFDFILEEDLKLDFINDYNEIESDIKSRRWKSSTVIAGSLIESLMFWRISSDNSISKPDRIALNGLIEICRSKELISSDVLKSCELAKDYRNLIHADRSFRLKKKCSRITALGSLSALDALIEELKFHEGR